MNPKRISDEPAFVPRRRRDELTTLRRNEALYRTFFDFTTDGVICHAADGSVISANAAAQTILGKSWSELEAASAWSLWRDMTDSSGQILNVWDIPCVRAMREGIQVKDQIVGVRHGKSCEPIWLQFESIPIVRADSTIADQVIVVFMDATNNRLTEDRFRVIIDASPNALFMVDQAGKLALANRAGEAMFGFKQVQLLGKNLNELIPETRLAEQLYRLSRDPGAVGEIAIGALGEMTGRHKSGDAIPLEVGLRYVATLEGEFTLATVVDVSARRNSQQEVAIANQLYQALFEELPDGILLIGDDLRVVGHNQEAQRLLQYAPNQLLKLHLADIESIDGLEEIIARKACIEMSGRDHFESVYKTSDGKHLEVDVSVNYVQLLTGERLFQVLFRDISEKKQAHRFIEKMAYSDHLTGLANRALLSDRLTQAMVHARRRGDTLGVAFLDLDGFKAINDAHGHQSGDALLVALASRLKNVLREGDTLARMGGDEFVAVLVDLPDADACTPMLQRLMDAAAQPVFVGAAKLEVTASLGVTFYPQDDVDTDVLLRHADQAMYLAKQAGKNRYHLFDIAHDAAIQGRHGEIKRIGEALSRGEFVLYYQPKVNMRTGKVIGAEALIRWQHPDKGLMTPGAFLPIIEDHPISIDLGEWVIDTALQQLSVWRAQGLDMVISVNIGALQLQQMDFPGRLADILARHPDVKPQCLELEILETNALQDMARVTTVMHACRAMGVAFALDDFGTGYSSLTYLKHLPADILKIDQSFIRNMTDGPDDLAIVKAVIGLAQVFNRSVIAEGVETKALGDLLLEIGCELAQGYGVARPMPSQAIPQWVATWRAGAVWAT